jgi:hypothetical protein
MLSTCDIRFYLLEADEGCMFSTCDIRFYLLEADEGCMFSFLNTDCMVFIFYLIRVFLPANKKKHYSTTNNQR